MARLAAQWRHSNLVKLVTLKKGNHPDEAYVRRGRRKALYRRERDSLEGPQEEAEIQRKALRREKNSAFSEDTCLENERVRSKVTPRKTEVGLKRRREPSKKWLELTEKASHFLGLREKHQISDLRSDRNRAPCVASTAVGTEGRRTKWPDRQRKESS